MAVHSTPIRLLVADDHAVVREGIFTACRKEDDIKIVGEASNGAELVQQARQLQHDVILVDIQMPVMDGIEATRQIMTQDPSSRIIAFTMFGEETFLLEMLAAGACGYILKQARTEELLTAIRSVYPSGHYYCRDTSRRVAHLISQKKYDPKTKACRTDYTAKEVEIIRHICDGASNKEIAHLMGLSVRTIEGYRERIQEKMDVKNTAGIVKEAILKRIYVAAT